MFSLCIVQPAILSRLDRLILVLTVIGFSLGFSGCSDTQPVARPKSVELRAPDSLVENKISKPLSNSAPRVEKQSDPISDKSDHPQADAQDAASGKTAQTQNTAEPEQASATTKPAEVSRDTSTDPDARRDDELSDSGEGEEQDEVVAPLFEIAEEQSIEFPDSWKRLGQNEIWIDMKNKQVILAGYVCINVGALEMFACPAGTKEHESVVAVNALASEMHAALLAVGAEPGAPCSWDDVSFTTASGSKINIDVRWRDEKTKEVITRPAKEMLKVESDQKLDIEWIFGGSRFHEDIEAKFRSYSANSGEMICVSNFSTAAIDVNIDSTDANGSWLFWANTDKIPPRGTRVYLILSVGDYFKAQRHVLAEAEPPSQGGTLNGGEDKNMQPAAREPDAKGSQPSGDRPIEADRSLTPPVTKEPSSDKG